MREEDAREIDSRISQYWWRFKASYVTQSTKPRSIFFDKCLNVRQWCIFGISTSVDKLKLDDICSLLLFPAKKRFSVELSHFDDVLIMKLISSWENRFSHKLTFSTHSLLVEKSLEMEKKVKNIRIVQIMDVSQPLTIHLGNSHPVDCWPNSHSQKREFLSVTCHLHWLCLILTRLICKTNLIIFKYPMVTVIKLGKEQLNLHVH